MKTRLLSLLAVFFITLASFGQQPVDSRQREIVIRSVNIVPMDSERILENQSVLIKDGKIVALGKSVKYGKNALVIDGTGKYLMPGLAEMHAHVPPVDDVAPMKDVLFLFAANGITTVRGMLGHPKHLELRTMVQRGEVLGPHFYTTGPSFNGMSITSAQAGAEQVRKQKSMGYDFLKMHPGLTREKFDAIAATANEVGIPFAGHVSFGVGIWRAIDAGYSSIDHLDGFIEGLVPGIEKMTEQETGLFAIFVADQADTTQIPKLMNALKTHSIWVVPTQSLADRWFSPDFTVASFAADPDSKYMKRETVDGWNNAKNGLVENPKYDAQKVRDFINLRRQLILACQKSGVGLLLGCDAPQIYNVPGFSTHNELEYLVRCGLTPYQALVTGTVNVANYLKVPNSGVIKEGALADMILINANPLKDIRATKDVQGVMLNGKWLSKEFINDGLKKLEVNK